MCKKIKEVIKNYCAAKGSAVKSILLIWIILILINCIRFTVDNSWSIFFYYPEKDYQLLELEAYSMIENKDFTTEYHLDINQYDNQNDSILFTLSTNVAFLNVQVDNYNKNNQTISIERVDKSKIQYVLKYGGVVALIIPLLFALMMYAIFIILLAVVYIGLWIIEKISLRFKK